MIVRSFLVHAEMLTVRIFGKVIKQDWTQKGYLGYLVESLHSFDDDGEEDGEDDDDDDDDNDDD